LIFRAAAEVLRRNGANDGAFPPKTSRRSRATVRESPAQQAPPSTAPYPAEKARGGEIILKTPLRRWVFISGLFGTVVLVSIPGLFRWA
jgi:hypothetical protein